MNKKLVFAFAIWTLVMFSAALAEIYHLRKVIHDKQEYIDAGAKGWYQGEEE